MSPRHHCTHVNLGQETLFFTIISSRGNRINNVGWRPDASALAFDCRHIEQLHTHVNVHVLFHQDTFPQGKH